MVEPITTAALGVATGALCLQGVTASRKLLTDLRKSRKGKPATPQRADEERLINCMTSGTGQVKLLESGAIFAGGSQQGDMTFTTVRMSTRVVLPTTKISDATSMQTASNFTGNHLAAASDPGMQTMLMFQQMMLQAAPQPSRVPRGLPASVRYKEEERIGEVSDEEDDNPKASYADYLEFMKEKRKKDGAGVSFKV